jgi:Leucine-rich repeat (LRR) protein
MDNNQPVPLPAQLALEIEMFYTHMASLPRDDKKSQGVCQSEIMQRADLFKRCVRYQYKRISDVRPSDKQFLADFFNSTGGHRWRNKFGWIGQKRTIVKPELKVLSGNAALYGGVYAERDRVERFEKSGDGCTGPLVESVGQLTGCKFLTLNCNRLKGRIPSTLRYLSSLESLHLSANRLEGALDHRTLESLTSLRVLNLSFNKLEGILPDAFESMPFLRELNLSGNKFSGSLPQSMSKLQELEILKLYNNNFDGNLPEWIANLTKLQFVNISQNK